MTAGGLYAVSHGYVPIWITNTIKRAHFVESFNREARVAASAPKLQILPAAELD